MAGVMKTFLFLVAASLTLAEPALPPSIDDDAGKMER